LSCAEPLVKGTCQAGVSWLGLGLAGLHGGVVGRARVCVAQARDRMGLENAIFGLHIETRASGELARKFSLFEYPLSPPCCGMEFMALWAPKYDIARFRG